MTEWNLATLGVRHFMTLTNEVVSVEVGCDFVLVLIRVDTDVCVRPE